MRGTFTFSQQQIPIPLIHKIGIAIFRKKISTVWLYLIINGIVIVFFFFFWFYDPIDSLKDQMKPIS